MNLSPDMHSYILFASAAKHTMDDALRYRRRADNEGDWWLADQYRRTADRLRRAAWQHLKDAREGKRSAPRC